MSIQLTDYADLLEDLSPHTRQALEANWHDATKVFSPRGLDNYLKGVSAIRGLGRGDSLVETWIEEAPMVAKEVGEDVIVVERLSMTGMHGRRCIANENRSGHDLLQTGSGGENVIKHRHPENLSEPIKRRRG